MELAFKSIVTGEHTGYGGASRSFKEALVRRGVEISPDSGVKLNFCMPPDYDAGEYTIGYTPWESTEVPLNWRLPMRGVDDLWTTATWVKDVFKEVAPHQEVYVVPHGIDPVWEPKVHILKPNEAFYFIHMGEPAIRKGGDLVIQAWYKAFRNRTDPAVRLVFKSVGPPWARVKDSRGHILCSPPGTKGIEVYDTVMSEPDLVKLFHSMHCMVYPSRGEGFGLIPFQAMATGLPTIMPSQGMGDYSDLAVMNLEDSKWVHSSDQMIHPGNWMEHSLDELIYKMEVMIAHYNDYAQEQYKRSADIRLNYSWDNIADLAIRRIERFVP